MNLFPQHEVAFSVHHQLLVNLLEFELVVSLVVVAVVLDLVSTLDALVLVVVLVRRDSFVVLVLGEIVVVVDLCVIAVSMVAMRIVVTHVIFAAETLSVVAVVSDPVLRTPCLERSSGSSPSVGDSTRSRSFKSRQLIRHCLKFSNLSQILVIAFHLSRLLTMRF